MRRLWLIIGGLSGLAAVGGGAATRHLAGGDAHLVELAGIAGQYAMYHALALLALAALMRGGATPEHEQPERKPGYEKPGYEKPGYEKPGPGRDRCLAAAAWCFSVGIVLFSGSLYALVLGAPPLVGWATPLGGTLFLLGWATLVVGGLRS